MSLQPHGLQATRLLSPWNSSGKNPGAGCHFLLQGIFPTQGSNPCLLSWQGDFTTEPPGKPPPPLCVDLLSQSCFLNVGWCGLATLSHPEPSLLDSSRHHPQPAPATESLILSYPLAHIPQKGNPIVPFLLFTSNPGPGF